MNCDRNYSSSSSTVLEYTSLLFVLKELCLEVNVNCGRNYSSSSSTLLEYISLLFVLKALCLEVNMNCGRNYKLNRGYELNAPRGSKYKKTKLIETTGHISTLPSTDFILTDVLVLPLILLNGFEDKVL